MLFCKAFTTVLDKGKKNNNFSHTARIVSNKQNKNPKKFIIYKNKCEPNIF
jgi:hypothetical protein